MITTGVLKMNPRGRWEIVRKGHVPYELSSGSRCFVETDTGTLRMTRIESREVIGPLTSNVRREYYSIDGFHLADGLRAAPPTDSF
jgi:hypothetical protein